MTDDLMANRLRAGASHSDYRFFFDHLRHIDRDESADALHYFLYRFLRDGDREKLLRELPQGSSSINGAISSLLSGRRTGPQSQFPRSPTVSTQNQDIWIKGGRLAKGAQDCDARYKIISAYLRRFKRPFSVLDLDAGLGYYSLRITEDFNAVCVSMEGEQSEWLARVLEANESRAIFGLRKQATLDDLVQLSKCEQFDVVLGLSVLDRIAAPAARVIEALRALGQHVIIEQPAIRQDNGLDAKRFHELGPCNDPAGDAPRSLMACEGYRASILRPYLQAFRSCPSVVLTMDDHRCLLFKDGVARSFTPGLNAHSFLYHQGFYPDPSALAASLPDDVKGADRQGVAWWNVVLGADGAIVTGGENAHNAPLRSGFSNNVQMALMEEIATLCGYKKLSTSNDYIFGEARSELALLGPEWCEPERDRVWSSGYENSISFPGHIAQAALAVRLKATVAPMAEGFDARYVTVKINGHIVSESAMAAGEAEIAFTAPQSIWNLANPAVMTIEMDHLYNPMDEGDGLDDRNLGIALHSIHLARGGRFPWLMPRKGVVVEAVAEKPARASRKRQTDDMETGQIWQLDRQQTLGTHRFV